MKKNYILLLSILLSGFSVSAQMIGGISASASSTSLLASPNMNCDILYSFPSPVTPGGLAFDGTLFYSNGTNDLTIYKYDITGQLVGTIPSPAINSNAHGDIDFDGTNLWVLVEEDNAVYKLDPSDGTVIFTFIVEGSTDHYGCAFDNGSLWVSDYTTHTIKRIDATTGEVMDTFPVDGKLLPLEIINGDLYGIVFEDGTPSGPML
ncbi:MAG TPA: hypothetical protein VGB43_03890, partial [Flavobacterium sp.]